MAPKQRIISAPSRNQQPKGFIPATYATLTAPENATVVRSIVVFGTAVAFLHSSLSELLLPAL